MKLTILNCEIKTKGSYLVYFRYGNQTLTDEITVSEGVVPYIEYSDRLQDILHKDVGEAKKMNQTMFKLYRNEIVKFPVEIGDF